MAESGQPAMQPTTARHADFTAAQHAVAGRRGEDRSPVAWGMTLLAIAFAVGISIGWHWPLDSPWLLSVGVVGLASSALVAHLWRRCWCASSLIMLAMLLLGATWVQVRHEYVAADDLAAMIADEAVLVRLEGIATRSPELRPRTAGSMARFDYREPASYFPMRVQRILPREGAPMPARGAVLVRVDQTLPPFRAGDHVQATGYLLRPAMPRNPGEFDFRRYAKSLGQAGILTVGSRELVEITPADRWAVTSRLLEWRDLLRWRASAWLLAHLPERELPARDALLVSLMLGQRDAEIDGLHESFRRVGLAHILAISGFHMAVLAGFVAIVAAAVGCSRRTTGVLVIVATLVYLLLVEPRMPVLRAGIMTIAACVGMLMGRRLHVGGMIALSAMLLLLWRPDQLFNVGFQLSYGVVLGLVMLAGPIRQRWLGRVDSEAATTMRMLGEWSRNALAVAITAWLVAVPLTLYHFGSVAVVGIPMSVVAVPLASIVLALGFAKIVIGVILPSVAMIIGAPLSACADVLLLVVNAVDGYRWSTWSIKPPGAAWTVVALCWVWWWGSSRRYEPRWKNRVHALSLAALLIWLIWPLLPLSQPRNEALRIDMLAVGDGSCYVLRSNGRTMVFDAGSSTDLNAGKRSIIPAMRHLGVRDVDEIIITHSDLDHFSAVLELVEEFDVHMVRVTPQFMASAAADVTSPTAYLLDRLSRMRVPVHPLFAGERWRLGACDIECVHPPADQHYPRSNDASVVLRITTAGRVVQMTGDIQAGAMARLMTPEADLRADVLELPHHGSYLEIAAAFVERVSPQIVLQSTGWTRWKRDRWAQQLAGRQRLITARDGACVVTIARDGTMHAERFLQPGAIAGGEEVE